MRILGIELGSWSLKAVEIESRFKQTEILDLHEIRLPLEIKDPVSNYKQGIEKLIARLPSHPEKIVTSLPASQTALRFLKIPVKQRKKAEQMFRFELEDNVPLDLEESIVEHQVSRAEDTSVVFAAIAPKKQIKAHIEWLNAVGLDPDWLTFEGMGLINLYLQLRRDNKEKSDLSTGPILLMDIGHLKTNFAFFREDQLEFFRSIPWGGMSLTQYIASSLSLSLDDAEEVKHSKINLAQEPGAPEQSENPALFAVQQGLLPLIADINHSIVSYRSQNKRDISEILLIGGTSRMKGMRTFLGEQLGIKTRRLKDVFDIPVPKKFDNTKKYHFAEALGRATVFGRKAALLFNFRKEDLAKANSLTAATTFLKDPNIIRAGQYVGILALLLFVHVFASMPIARKEMEKKQEALEQTFGQVFREVPKKVAEGILEDPESLEKYLNNRQKELKQKLALFNSKKISAVTLIRDISDAFPSSLRVDVNSVALDDRQFTIEGVLYEGDLETVTANLKNLTEFDNIQVEQRDKRFTYRGNISGR